MKTNRIIPALGHTKYSIQPVGGGDVLDDPDKPVHLIGVTDGTCLVPQKIN